MSLRREDRAARSASIRRERVPAKGDTFSPTLPGTLQLGQFDVPQDGLVRGGNEFAR